MKLCSLVTSAVTGGGRCHNLRNGKEASEGTEESPAGCAGEGKQKKRKLGEEERTD